MLSITLASINQKDHVSIRNKRVGNCSVLQHCSVPTPASWPQPADSAPAADLARGWRRSHQQPPAPHAADQLAGNEAEQHCRFRPPPATMFLTRGERKKKQKLLTLVSPNQSQRDPRGSSSQHNFQSKGFLIYERKLQMFIFTAGAFRPVMDNRWKLSRRTQEAAIPTGW